MILNILHLYPREMNLYGDHGNVKVLQKRCEWRGIHTKVYEHEPGMAIPADIDIIFGGGGQDSGQGKIESDLQKISPKLKKLIENGTPCLVVCGLYQLFGEYFQTAAGDRIEGINILPLTTIAGNKRLIGNIQLETKKFGNVIGYENHSGLTRLSDGAAPFGKVILGAGNNNEDGTEGVIYKNCIGTYLHGPLLPKNPRIADFIIQTAIERKYPNAKPLEPLDDSVEREAHKVAFTRPR